MDCPICFNVIENSCIGSCTHHFCLPCMLRWCHHGGTDCPKCKTPIISIREDKEFDSLNNPDAKVPKMFNPIGDSLIINFEPNDVAGVTLENNAKLRELGIRAPGVIISKINEKQKCYQVGLRKKDILIFINNVPCMDHKQTIDVINSCVVSQKPMECQLLKIRNI